MLSGFLGGLESFSQRRSTGKLSRKPRRPAPSLEQLEAREVPALLGNQLFPDDNAWNQKITNAPVASNSANVINNITAEYGNVRLFNDFYHDSQDGSQPLYGIPITIVHGNTTPKINVVIDGYPDESDIFAAPIPPNAVIEGDNQGGVHVENDGDRHMLIYDVDNNIAYEFYGTRPPSDNPDGKWHALEETVWDFKTNTFVNSARQIGWTSVDAAGLSVLAGLARPDEGLPVSQGGQGLIDHALRFTLRNDVVLDKYLYPASHHANEDETSILTKPPMGARFRLKASVDISTLNPQTQVVAQALKDYGLMLADNGSNMFINGASSVFDADTGKFLTWTDSDISSTTKGLRSLHLSDFELVDLTPRVTGLSTASGPAGTTLTIIGQNFSGSAGHLAVIFHPATGSDVVVSNVTYIDDAHISVVVPAGSGTVDIRVRSGQTNLPGDSSSNVAYPVFGYGISANTAADNFTYSTTANQPPTVAIAANATPSPVNGTTTGLSVQGADDGGAASLTYTWAVTAKPTGATNPTFSANGTNAARNSTATFSRAGTYTFTVTIADAAGLTTTSSVNVTVNQTLTSIIVTPGTVNLGLNGTQQFTATARDQFGVNLTTQPAITWSVSSGPGSVSSSGQYTAGTTAGTATLRAASGAVAGTATANVSNSAPIVQTPAAAVPNPVPGTSTTLTVLGADDAGESALTYTWAVTSKPSGASDPTFSVNGTNASKNSVATFSRAGVYGFTVTIRDASGLTTTSSVNVTVNQTLTSIVLSPSSASVVFNGTQQFAATARDQFGNNLTTQPTFTWSLVSGGVGSVSSSGLYTAGTTAGTATVRAASGAVNGTATVTVGNNAPTVATAASANPSPVAGATTTLSVLGADDAGEASLTYTWAVTSKPTGAADPTFSVNGTNASKSSVATFSRAGAYGFTVTIRDAAGLTTTSAVNVTVNQTLTSIVLSPPSATVALNGSQQFAATARDQFGANLATQPAFTWSLVSGPGSVSSSGLYTAGTTAGTATVRAASGAVNGTATVAVGNNAPTVATAASATPGTVTGTTTTLSVLGADDAGEAGLTYTWAVTSKPTGANDPTFGANGTNAARNSTATFSRAGTYGFTVTIRDAGGLTTTSSVNVTVSQSLTSVVLSPSSVNLALNGSQQFAATARDQFGNNLTTQPAFTWSLASGVGSVSSTGLYTAGTTAGTATIRAASGAIAGTATAVVGNSAPTVATAASATPGTVNGTTTTLSVLGADDAGEAGLTYTWAVTSKPSGAADPTFSANGSNASKSSVATFSRAGAYGFTVTIRDASGLTTTSSVNVTVNQTLTSIALSPSSVNLVLNGTQQFAATAKDQFGNNLTTPPAFTWSLVSGPGSVSSSGLFTAGTTAGTATIRAASGAVNGTATAVVGNNAPTVATAASAPATVAGKTVTLSALGADDGGEAGLTYTWSGSGPAAVTFSANGTNASKTSVATFTQAGNYTFTVTIRDAGGLTVTSSVSVAVNQTLTTVGVTPATASVPTNGTQQFTATAKDQFGTNLPTQPAFTWALASGTGSVSATGLYRAGTTAGSATVRAISGAISGTASVTVVAPTGPVDVTSLVRVSNAQSIQSLGGNQYRITYTVTNTSSQTITGPIRLAFAKLPSGGSVVSTTTLPQLTPTQSGSLSVVVQLSNWLQLFTILQTPPRVFAG